jgi:hypothetical protein
MSHFVATENVFETIGNYPVVDQFDVDYTAMLSGSTTDHYITGTLFRRTIEEANEITFFQLGERGRVFSKIGAPVGSYPRPQENDSTSYEHQPWRERSNSVRFVKILSDRERYYDSIPPDLSEAVKRIGGRIRAPSEGAEYLIFEFGPDYPGDAGLSTWSFRFPFEAVFNGINRSPKNLYVAEYKTNNQLLTSSIQRQTLQVKSWISGDDYDALWYDDIDVIATNSDAKKVIFGWGDWEYYKFFYWPGRGVSRTLSLDAYNHKFPVPRWTIGTAGGQFISPVIRGWKYGLISANPHYTGCVFRRDRYGQLRDMLEQRPDTRFFTDLENSPYRYFPSPRDEGPAIELGQTDSAPQEISDPAVRVRHVRQAIDLNGKLRTFFKIATTTSASNISPFCTSSLPYFDNRARNR